MLVSIIVPVYNIENYIERCLESIISQTYKNIEIIVVIDGSKDRSEDICREYAFQDRRITIITKENGGLSSARNAGIDVAAGDYVLFVDGDDWISEDCVESGIPYMKDELDIIMMGFVREYGESKKSAFLFLQDQVFVGDEKNWLTRRLVGPIGREYARPHTIEDINTAWGKLYRRALISYERFMDTKIIGTEDLWFNLLVFNKAESIAYIHKELFHYNKENAASLTGAYNNKLFERWKVLYKYIDNYLGTNYISDNAKEALNNRIVIEQFALSRNVINSNLEHCKKHDELKRVLNDPIYRQAFKNFDYSPMPLYWKAFYKACEWRISWLVELILFVAGKIK